MKILIAGATGAGKSTIARELTNLGYTAYDSDNVSGLTRWEDKNGNPVERLDNPPADWFDHHNWNWNRQKMQELLTSYETAFVCGSSSNMRDLFDLFDKIFLLRIDEPTLRDRLANRTSNDFGKHPHELVSILSWFDWFQKDLADRGAVVIDATQPVAQVVNQILGNLHDKR
jgi:gluconate kinase